MHSSLCFIQASDIQAAFTWILKVSVSTWPLSPPCEMPGMFKASACDSIRTGQIASADRPCLPVCLLGVPHRLKEARDVCSLSALSINMRKKRQPVIWSVPKLPSDACSLMAVPRGGVLVLSQNLLMYYAQVGQLRDCTHSSAFYQPSNVEQPNLVPAV